MLFQFLSEDSDLVRTSQGTSRSSSRNSVVKKLCVVVVGIAVLVAMQMYLERRSK